MLQSQIDVALANRHDLMPGQAHQPGYRREGHFPAHRHDQRLEKQGKAGQPSGPVGFDLPNAAIGQAYARDANLQVALMLKEVQVPIALGHGVVRRVCPLDAGHGKAAARDEVDSNRQRLLRHVKLDPVDVPRGGNAQGGFEQLGGHIAVTHVSQGRASYPRTRSGNRRACLHGWMHNPAASSHGPAYRPIPGVKGALRRAAITPQPALDPRPRATSVTHHHPLEIQKRHILETAFNMRTPTILCAIVVLALGGCATVPPPPLNYSVPNVGISKKKHDAEVKSILVAIARPDEATGKLHSNMDKTPPLWKNALEEALNAMVIFSDEGSRKVNIVVRILRFEPPQPGGEMTTSTEARYEITDRKTGDILYTQNVASSGVVPFEYSIIGLTRMIESANRAVRNNITQFLQGLESANFNKPMFPANKEASK